jgi:hypothetical protein
MSRIEFCRRICHAIGRIASIHNLPRVPKDLGMRTKRLGFPRALLNGARILTSVFGVLISLAGTDLFADDFSDLLGMTVKLAQRQKSVAKVPDDLILSVLVHREWVFASTPKGIFRASPHDKKWVSIRMGDSVPCAGWLAKEEPACSSIYYSAARTASELTPTTTRKAFGLYRFAPQGDRWELVSPNHEFSHVYAPDNWRLYGIEEGPVDPPHAPNPFVRTIRMSKDRGEHWDDISHSIRGYALDSIIPDPDHDGLICVLCTGFVLQADDAGYRWRPENLSEWTANRHPRRWLFNRTCESGIGGAGLLAATLSNYFDHPFGEQTIISAFDARVAATYRFKQGEPVLIPFDVTYSSFLKSSVTLVDTERGNAVWGLGRFLPDGSRDGVGPGVRRRVGDSRTTTSINGERRPAPVGRGGRTAPGDLQRHRLSDGQSYKRSLVLSEMCDFSKPGRYRVQIEYDNGQAADDSKGEWVGRFTSRDFEVNIISSGL